ncbi:MAG: hypothetical protein FWF40_03650 [Methanomassiliicoccaceae archaeon]|nr:hypothetical protein [Methanomassiliicoccaceae archaeon]
MASEETSRTTGSVRTQDMSVSWISEPGLNNENTDRIGILTMANGQIRLTMQSSTINLKGMRLTKGHICVFALFEAAGNDTNEAAAADKASEVFINNVMKYDITKKPAASVLKKCLSKADKAARKEFGNAGYKASVAAFAGKDMTACSVNGARMLISHEDRSIREISSPVTEILPIGASWKNVMMFSGGITADRDTIEDDMRSSIGDLAAKKSMRELSLSSSIIRVQKI